MRKESVLFNGFTYTRYPESKRKSDRVYFSGRHGYLHRAIWESVNGIIPKGFHIHHKDGNRDNNDISNLELVPISEHESFHNKGRGASPEHLAKIRGMGAAWTKTPEGRARLRIIRKEQAKHMRTIKNICQQCGKEYDTYIGKGGKFCSNNCKSAYRRSLKRDDETRLCSICDKEFRCNKYFPTRTCSVKCQTVARKQTLGIPF